MPSVSVIIPVYNRAHSIGRAMASVLAQAAEDTELIIVDDGSSDASAAAAAATGDRRVRILRHERNRGAAAARNTGVAMATGEVVAFLDSDDEWLPGKLDSQMTRFAGAGFRGALCTGYTLHRVASGSRCDRTPVAAGSWRVAFLDGCTVSPGSTLMVPRAIFESVGPFDGALVRLEDWDWLLRLMDGFDFGVVPQIGALVHLDGQPPVETIRRAARLMRDKHRDRVRRFAGTAGWRRFLASLEIECAAAALRHGRPATAAGFLCRAAIQSPARLARLAGRVGHRVIERDL